MQTPGHPHPHSTHIWPYFLLFSFLTAFTENYIIQRHGYRPKVRCEEILIIRKEVSRHITKTISQI